MTDPRPAFLVVGHPRSGTGYMAALLHRLGYDVGHERLGRDGISAWMLSVPDLETPWCNVHKRWDEFQRVIHVVRDPRTALASVAITEYGSLPHRAKVVELPLVANDWELAALSWLRWNDRIESREPDVTIRLERAFVWLPFELERWGYRVTENVKDPGPVNVRKHQTPPWDRIISELSPATLDALLKQSARYGYDF